MSSKLLFLLFALLAISCAVEAKSFVKKFHQAHHIAALQSPKKDKVLEHIRQRRSVDVVDQSDEFTDEEATALLKFFVAALWESEKQEVLADFLEEMADSDTNITVIGWQKIHDDQGQLKEVNTVQLVIPPKPVEEGNKETDHDDDDDDEEEEYEDRIIPYKDINVLKEIFEPLEEVGIPASVTFEEFTKKGDREILIYMNKDELYIESEGFAIYNKTVVATPEQVEEFIKKQTPTILGPPSVLRYDVDGHIIPDKSTIYPPLLGNVIDHYEAPDNVLLEAPAIIAKVSQLYPKPEVPKHLAESFNKAFPDYTWRVLVDPTYYYITRDVSVTVSYDNFDLDENSNISYTVYGVKKATEAAE